MITVTVTKRYGAATVRASISAPSIEEAVEVAGEGARVEFPIDGQKFFARVAKAGIDYGSMTLEELETAYDAGLPGAADYYLDLLATDMRDPVLAAELREEGLPVG